MSDRETAPTAPQQEKVAQRVPQDPTELFGRVSHDELCDTLHEKIQTIDGETEDDLFSISGTDSEFPEPPK